VGRDFKRMVRKEGGRAGGRRGGDLGELTWKRSAEAVGGRGKGHGSVKSGERCRGEEQRKKLCMAEKSREEGGQKK